MRPQGNVLTFFERPISGTIMVIAIFFLVLPLVKVAKDSRKRRAQQ